VGRICTLDGVPVIGVAACYSGSLEEGEKVLAPLRGFGSPLADLFRPMSYVQMQSMFDPWFPPGRQAYWKANFLHGLPDEAIDTFHRYALTAPSPYTTGPWLETVHGAVSRVGRSETAFARRRHPFNFLVLASWEEPSEAERNIAWMRECWEAMLPFMVPGAYVNYLERRPTLAPVLPTATTTTGSSHSKISMIRVTCSGSITIFGHPVRSAGHADAQK
jgi:hypothetical protein